MGEYIPASIQFGGQLQAEYIPELIALLNAQCLRTAEDEETPTPNNLHEEFYNTQVNYGNLTDLEDFAIHHGLAYEHWHDCGPDWMEATHKQTPQSERRGHVIGSRMKGFYLCEEQLKNGAELLAWMKSPLPPLEIITPYGLYALGSPKAVKPCFGVKITQVLRVQKSTIICVEAEDEADLAAMIDEGSIDVPCADDDTFDVWTTDHASLENETQEPI
jgi:hypothetical protein